MYPSPQQVHRVRCQDCGTVRLLHPYKQRIIHLLFAAALFNMNFFPGCGRFIVFLGCLKKRAVLSMQEPNIKSMTEIRQTSRAITRKAAARLCRAAVFSSLSYKDRQSRPASGNRPGGACCIQQKNRAGAPLRVREADRYQPDTFDISYKCAFWSKKYFVQVLLPLLPFSMQ